MLIEEKDRQNPEVEIVNAPIVAAGAIHSKVKFEVFGEEMLEKNVRSSGNSGRVYLPPEWVGHRVKVVRMD